MGAGTDATRGRARRICAMAEFKYVSLPTAGKEVRSPDVEAFASAELNRDYVAQGWLPVSVTRPASIGAIGFLLRRD